MKNDGDTTLGFSCEPSFHIYDESNKIVEIPLANIMPPCAAEFPFGPNSELTLIWNQIDEEGQVKSGNYTVVTKSYHPWYTSYLISLTYDDEFVERATQTTSFEIVDENF